MFRGEKIFFDLTLLIHFVCQASMKSNLTDHCILILVALLKSLSSVPPPPPSFPLILCKASVPMLECLAPEAVCGTPDLVERILPQAILAAVTGEERYGLPIIGKSR